MNSSPQAGSVDCPSLDTLSAIPVLHKRQDLTSSPRLPVADMLRGLAAFWVFLFHASEGHHIDGLVSAMPDVLVEIVFSSGHLGVAIFFVLSGLVIAMSGERSGNGMVPAASFLARRIVRLAPAYYVSLGIALLFLLLKHKSGATGVVFPEPVAIVAHLLFLQDFFNIQPLNSVYWTLCIEIQFYFMFCGIMLLARSLGRGYFANNGLLPVMAVACAVAALWPLGLVPDGGRWQASFLPTWHLFLLGMLLHYALNYRGISVVPFFAYLGLLAVSALATTEVFTLAGIVAAIVLYSMSRWQSEGIWKRIPLLNGLGLISYSFYLLHNPITGAAFNVTKRLVGTGIVAELSGLILSFCLCVAAAAISYVMIERPTIRWARQFRS